MYGVSIEYLLQGYRHTQGNPRIDLKDLLESEPDLYFDGHHLSNEEKQRLIDVVTASVPSIWARQRSL